jgi:hypothetical protein
MRIGILKTSYNFFHKILKPLLVFLKMEGKKKKKPGEFLQGLSRTRPNGISKKLNCPTLVQTQCCAGETHVDPLPMSLTWECQ